MLICSIFQLLIIHTTCSVQVATNIPVANTGTVALLLRRTGHDDISIGVKNSAVAPLGDYEVHANSVIIANITSSTTSFTVTPSTSTVYGASFAVYVNLSN